MRRLPLRSPPRVRGKVERRQREVSTHGITPAYAGKSLTAPMIPTGGWDHPRVCGEKGSSGKRQLTGLGSPPRMRGKDGRTSTGGLDVGITPACAGKSIPHLQVKVVE